AFFRSRRCGARGDATSHITAATILSKAFSVSHQIKNDDLMKIYILQPVLRLFHINTLWIGLALLALPLQTGALATGQSPNFIFCLTDDHGWTSRSVAMDDKFPEGRGDYFGTPNISRLAA